MNDQPQNQNPQPQQNTQNIWDIFSMPPSNPQQQQDTNNAFNFMQQR